MKKYVLIILGFFLISLFVWFRFLKSRMPKDIPFYLFVLSYFTIFCSTMLYIYIIYRLIKPSKNTKLSQELQEIFLAPLKELNNFLLKHYDAQQLFIPMYKYISNIYLFYFMTHILPRMVTVIALAIDIFLLAKFQCIYKVIYITLIPLFTRYFIYSLTIIKDGWITQLSEITDPVSTPYVMGVHPDEWPENQTEETEDYDILPDFMNLSLELFIPYQSNYIIAGEKPPIYRIYPRDQVYAKYKEEFNVKELLSKHITIIHNRLDNEVEKILELSVFIVRYQQAYIRHKYLRDIKIIIYVLYVLCWSYFLCIATPKVLWITGLMSLLHTLNAMEDPFSGYLMFADLLAYVIENNDEFMVDIIPIKLTYK